MKTVNKEYRLLQRARKLDTKALAEVYDLYSPELYRYAVRLMNNEDLAEECVAETFKHRGRQEKDQKERPCRSLYA